ncbi:MAG: glycoside hydrolase family 15 protein [Micromonosporaceae bacterium]|nr:glycoside hydrolase family 15 protein [Micromonosporaceae bacterium]
MDDITPIEQYGLIGDTRTAALVAPDGAIDWLCVPSFDGEPVFASLVGGTGGGRFRLGPAGAATVVARRYRPESATLETVWDCAGGRLTLTDGMVAEVAGRLLPTTMLVRRLRATGAPIGITLHFEPRFGEGRRWPRTEQRGELLFCGWRRLALSVQTTPALAIEPGRPVTAVVSPDRPLTTVVCFAEGEPLVHAPPTAAWDALEADEARWRQWCREITEDVPRRTAVVRSLLTLRLLTYSPTGAPVAAPTTSLPEQLGGVRNWDYRYAWPRDASIGIGAFLGVGKNNEAHRFMAWLLNATRLDRPRLPVLFNLHGRRPHPDHRVDGWPGYAHSPPVRTGNDAANQRQLDGYGWVLDAAWLLTEAGCPLYAETWRAMAGFADTVASQWRETDAGIWEVRGGEKHHLHSKLMAWLALDRALRIAAGRRTAPRRTGRWRQQRDAIAADIRARGFDRDLGSYTRSYGSRDLDAALLILPLLGIEPADSRRIEGTIKAIRRLLGAGGPLLYRYPPGDDGLPGAESAFIACSFWLVQALARTGQRGEALSLFDELVDLGGPLGLYPEEIDPVSHRGLGNFPQALSHATLVQAALALRDAYRPDPAHR